MQACAAPSILIAMPTFRASVSAHTVVSVFALRDEFAALGIPTKFLSLDGSDIVTARNILASKFYERTAYTHLLFVDDDMTFEAETVIGMLRADKPVIGTVATKRKLEVDKIYESGARGEPIEAALASAVSFVVRHLPEGRLEVREGLCRVAGIGMALTLIRRDVLRTMAERGAAKPRETREDGTQVWGFFEQVQSEDGRLYLSEDYSFCQRWRDLGGEVWAVADRRIGHVGPFIFEGLYMDLLRTGRSA